MSHPLLNPLRRTVGTKLLVRTIQRRAAHRLTTQPFIKTAARLHARSATNKVAGPTSWRSIFGRFTLSFRTAYIGYAVRSTVQRAVHLKFGPVRLAVEAGFGRNISKQISPLLRGAAQAFTGSAGKSTPFLQRINLTRHPLVSFARSSFRPATGFGPKAPIIPRLHVHGAGLQTARNFSSGGRVFDNLVLNAPLALRLAGNEAEEKRREALASKGPRRTAALISQRSRQRMACEMGNKLVVSPLAAKKQSVAQVAENKACSLAASTIPSIDREEDYTSLMSTYFHFPPWTHTTRLYIRLSEPISVMLRGHSPHPSPYHRLFDPEFIEDAQLALAFEEARYLKARAILRILYEGGMLECAEIEYDRDRYVITMAGVQANDVRKLLEYECGFALDFVSYEEVKVPQGAVYDREDSIFSSSDSESEDAMLVSPILSSELSEDESFPSMQEDEDVYLYDSRELIR